MMQLKLTQQQQTKYSAEAEGLKNKKNTIDQLYKSYVDEKISFEEFEKLLIDVWENEIIVENKDKN